MAADETRILFLEVLMRKYKNRKHGDPPHASVVQLRLKKNANNRLVYFDRGKPRVTPEGDDLKIQILSKPRLNPKRPPEPVSDKARKILEEAGKLTAHNRVKDAYTKQFKAARKVGLNTPEPPPQMEEATPALPVP